VTGITSEQIRSAKQGALFVWCNESLQYPRSLARALGRLDLKIVGPGILNDREQLRGQEWPEIIIDHAARLTAVQREGLAHLTPQVRASPSSSTKSES